MESRGYNEPAYLIRNLEEIKTNKVAEICMFRSFIYIGGHLTERCDCPLSVNLNQKETWGNYVL